MAPEDRRAVAPLLWAIGALVCAVALALGLGPRLASYPRATGLVLAYALTWGPLVLALAATSRSWMPTFRFRGKDVLLGVGVGVIARAIGIIAAYTATGYLVPGTAVARIDASFVFTAAIAPVVLAPLIEEAFFRGLLQGALQRLASPWFAVVATAVVFVVVHTLSEGTSWALLLPLSAYALGVGLLRRRTGRIGGTIVAHAVFNGLAVLAAWPWGAS